MSVFLVTGASRGIGKRVAEDLAADGHEVFALSRRPHETGHGRIQAVAVDVASPDSVSEMAKSVAGRAPVLDGLVNAAGIIRSARLGAETPEGFDAVMRTNLIGTMLVTRAVLPLLARPGGAVVNVTTSLLGRPMPGLTAYIASKGAVLGFTRALAIELAAEGIRVNSVSPGLVRSDIWTSAGMSDADYTAYLERRAATYPLGRIGEPADVSAAIRHLLDPASGWVTGIDMAVDGGIGLNLAPAAP